MMIPLKTRQVDGDLSFNSSRLDLQIYIRELLRTIRKWYKANRRAILLMVQKSCIR